MPKPVRLLKVKLPIWLSLRTSVPEVIFTRSLAPVVARLKVRLAVAARERVLPDPRARVRVLVPVVAPPLGASPPPLATETPAEVMVPVPPRVPPLLTLTAPLPREFVALLAI